MMRPLVVLAKTLRVPPLRIMPAPRPKCAGKAGAVATVRRRGRARPQGTIAASVQPRAIARPGAKGHAGPAGRLHHSCYAAGARHRKTPHLLYGPPLAARVRYVRRK